MKWEYKHLPFYFRYANTPIDVFNQLGDEGWELVGIAGSTASSSEGTAYFKRVKPIEIALRVTNGLDVIARFDAFARRQPKDAISRYQIEPPKTAPYSHTYRVRPEDLTNVESVRTESEDCCL